MPQLRRGVQPAYRLKVLLCVIIKRFMYTEYCDGSVWRTMGSAPTLKQTTQLFSGNSLHMPNSNMDRAVTNGMFLQVDGFVGGYLACNSGTNRLSLYLTVDRKRTVSATAHDLAGSLNDFEIDHSSFFSVVSKGKQWVVWVRSNFGSAGSADLNKVNCNFRLTKFGQ